MGCRLRDIGDGCSTVWLSLRALHRGRLASRRGSVVDDLDGVRALALGGGAQVAEANGLLDGELAGHVGDVEPRRELVDSNKWHDGARDGIDSAVGGGPLGVGPDDEEAGLGSHGVW
jgi:hypothetical protein